METGRRAPCRSPRARSRHGTGLRPAAGACVRTAMSQHSPCCGWHLEKRARDPGMRCKGGVRAGENAWHKHAGLSLLRLSEGWRGGSQQRPCTRGNRGPGASKITWGRQREQAHGERNQAQLRPGREQPLGMRAAFHQQCSACSVRPLGEMRSGPGCTGGDPRNAIRQPLAPSVCQGMGTEVQVSSLSPLTHPPWLE